MRTLLFSFLVWCCWTAVGHASRPPSAKPCLDTEREFVELTLTVLVRHGYLSERDLFAHREPKPLGVADSACLATRAGDLDSSRTLNVRGGM